MKHLKVRNRHIHPKRNVKQILMHSKIQRHRQTMLNYRNGLNHSENKMK